MKRRKAILLLEVALATLLVSVTSIFLFRGYNIFSKADKNNSEYLRLVLFSEEKLCDLQIKQKNNELTLDSGRLGNFNLTSYSWQLGIEDSTHDSLSKGILRINHADEEIAFDTLFYCVVSE